MPKLWLVRSSIGLVWIHEGLWCKVLGHQPRQQAILAALPVSGAVKPHLLLVVLGLLECVIALWAISGWRPREGVVVQASLLIAMNAGGLIFAGNLIPDAPGMLIRNFVFLMLAWIAASGRTYEMHVEN